MTGVCVTGDPVTGLPSSALEAFLQFPLQLKQDDHTHLLQSLAPSLPPMKITMGVQQHDQHILPHPTCCVYNQ